VSAADTPGGFSELAPPDEIETWRETRVAFSVNYYFFFSFLLFSFEPPLSDLFRKGKKERKKNNSNSTLVCFLPPLLLRACMCGVGGVE